MRILIAESDGFSTRALERLRALGEVTRADLDADGLASALRGPDAPQILFVRLRHRLDAELLAAAPGLAAVVSPTTGLDHIDLEASAAHGIAVLSLRGETEFLRTVTATAEHTWALLLALVRRLPAAARAAAAGDWDRDRFRGRELRGKTLGIVGLGRLGSMVSAYGRAFGMRVVAHDPYREGWPEGVERASSLAALAAESDVLTVHVPLSDETRGLVDASVLRALPEGAVLVNTSRGGVVDETALLDELREGRLGGAALDVLEGETGPGGVVDRPLVAWAAEHDGLILTPHVGGATLESMENTEIFMAEKLARWLRGEPVLVDAGPAAAPSSPEPPA